MVVNFEFFMCVEFMVDLAVGGLVVGDGSDNMSEYIKGDYTKCYEDICEIWYEDNLYCIVRTDDADKLIDVLNENEQLKKEIEELEFKLRTIEAYDRTVKEEHSDTVYDFKKKLETW